MSLESLGIGESCLAGQEAHAAALDRPRTLRVARTDPDDRRPSADPAFLALLEIVLACQSQPPFEWSDASPAAEARLCVDAEGRPPVEPGDFLPEPVFRPAAAEERSPEASSLLQFAGSSNDVAHEPPPLPPGERESHRSLEPRPAGPEKTSEPTRHVTEPPRPQRTPNDRPLEDEPKPEEVSGRPEPAAKPVAQRPKPPEAPAEEHPRPGEERPRPAEGRVAGVLQETSQDPEVGAVSFKQRGQDHQAGPGPCLPKQAPETIVGRAKLLRSGGKQAFEMELEPPGSGKVHVEIESRRGVVRVKFRASDDVQRAALERDLPNLAGRLADRGLRVAAVEVARAEEQPSLESAAFERSGGQSGGPGEHPPSTFGDSVSRGGREFRGLRGGTEAILDEADFEVWA